MKSALILFVSMLMLPTLLTGCKPSPEQQVRVDEQRREHELNTIQQTDVLPNIDTTKFVSFKSGGKFFIGPKEYGFFNGSASFFWPSKTPHHSLLEYPEKAKVKAGKFHLVSIDFYVEPRVIEMNTYELIERASRDKSLLKRETIRKGLDRVEIKSPSATKTIDAMYVATDEKLPLSTMPPAISCSEESPLNGGGTRFMWKTGFSVYVTFSSAHCKDWPEIYTEIIRVLNLVKEA